ncbi:MAG TPA: enoyl-CoA hydratase-related protein, partial [Candidatus Acidoferrum sp.]|nr:enoyl-CoA hydratase-related protein [Candidatus Acidoferrum sp.]
MVETVNAEEFVVLPQKKKIEDYEFVKVRLEGGVARMTLSRPEHNLLNEAMLRELAEGIEHVGSRDDIKIILLESACKVFCGGIEVG